MERNFKNLFGLLGSKAKVPEISAVTAFEETRGGQPKSYIPNFFYKPPFGYPRYKDLTYFRQLANSIYVDMCETAIIDEVCSVQWDIVAEDRSGNEIPGKEKEVELVKDFFENPNTNKESWEIILRMMLSDLLEINSGILVKTFNSFGKMVEIVARDGMAFTKNPDVYGMYTNRADLILMKNIYSEEDDGAYTPENGYPLLSGSITPDQAREEGAYFQYGFNTGAKPVPFGKREIVWIEKKVRTDNLYGRSAMEVLAKTVQTLIYAVEHNLEYFNDNSIPAGVLGLDGMDAPEVKAFAKQWVESQKQKDDLGNWKKVTHKMPIVNKMPKFERLGFTNQELELIESQKWWSKMVWAAFGITATELGFTEDAKGSANQIVQSSIAKKRIIYPLLRLIEYHVNTEIIPELGVSGVRYKYKIFDVDEETKKWGLYKLQTESDLKTINEVRNAEGMDPLDGGDETSAMRGDRQQKEEREYYGGEPLQQDADKINRDSQDERDQMMNKSELKYKYVKRTGGPGHYVYWYKNPKTGKLESGDKPKENNEKYTDKYGNTFDGEDAEQARDGDEEHEEHVKRLVNKKGPLIKIEISIDKIEYTARSDPTKNISDNGRNKVKKQKELIKKVGIEKITPVLVQVRKIDGKNIISVVDGNHRLAAMRELGMKKIKVEIPKSDSEIIGEKETKALTTDSGLTLQPNEEMSPSEKKLKKRIVDLLKSNKKKVFELLEEQGKPEQLLQIKGLDDIPRLIKKFFSFFTTKSVSDEIIEENFIKGWDESEKQINKNVPFNDKALQFLQDYTFENIKGMTEEIANDLRAELERGIIDGESITKLKERVSKVFDVGENRAEMIARTETNRAENQGKLLSMKGSGIAMKKQWLTHKDDRTSPICNRLDGQIVTLDANFKDKTSGWEGQSPPSHVNCRSTVLYLLDE